MQIGGYGRNPGNCSSKLTEYSIHFPGALNSKFTSELQFKSPNDTPAITTYRLMDTDGVVIDKANEPTVDKEKAVKMYRDMVAGEPEDFGRT